jgi:transcriptional regulator with XRE-family HTH domain
MHEPIHTYARRLREARGAWLSQRKLATLAHVAPSTIFRLEAGKHLPSVETLEAVAPHLNTTADDLLERAGYRSVRKDAAPSSADNLPNDPLGLVVRALQAGPWPEAVSAAVYALLVAVVDDRRSLWEKRFNQAVEELQADEPSPSYMVLGDVPTTPELRAQVEAFIRTQSTEQWLSLRDRLFPPVKS